MVIAPFAAAAILPRFPPRPLPHALHRCLCFLLQALPNQQTVDYPSFKLVLVGDGGTGESPDLFLIRSFRGL
jgi:hypothetical protein